MSTSRCFRIQSLSSTCKSLVFYYLVLGSTIAEQKCRSMNFNHLTFVLIAELEMRSLPLDLCGVNFNIEADLQTDICEYIRDQVIQKIEEAQRVVHGEFQAAHGATEWEQHDLEQKIGYAEKDVDSTFRNWEEDRERAIAEARSVIDNYVSRLDELEAAVKKARGEFNNATRAAERDLQIANADRHRAMAAARRDVDTAKRDAAYKITKAQRAVDEAQKEVDLAFASAERSIENARKEVGSIRREIGDIRSVIDEYGRAPWYHFWKKAAIPGLWTTIGVLEVSLAVADAALVAANAMVESTNFVEKNVALGTTQGLLEKAKSASNFTLEVASAAVRISDVTSKAAVDAAEETVATVRVGGHYVVLETAIAKVGSFKYIEQATYEVALNTLNDLNGCAEAVSHQIARNALTIARVAPASIEVANITIEGADAGINRVLEAAKTVSAAALGAFQIHKVTLSGSLHGMVERTCPLKAHIELVLLDNLVIIDASFDPRHPGALITDISDQ